MTQPTDAEVEAVARAIYDAPDTLSGDFVGTVIMSADHLWPSQEHLMGNSTTESYRLATMQVCRDAARAAIIALDEVRGR